MTQQPSGQTKPSGSLRTKVTRWLRSQGYPLEMMAAGALRSAGFEVSQGAYFQDPEENTPRELDALAFRGWTIGEISWRLILILECKDKSSPWVIFTRPTGKEQLELRVHHYAVPASRLGRQLILGPAPKVALDLPLLEVQQRIGYGVVQAIGGNSREPYEAVMKIVKAARVQAEAVDTKEYLNQPYGLIVCPIMVLGGSLFESYLTDGNDLVVREVPQGVLHWPHPVAGAMGSLVRIITKAHLDTLIQGANRTVATLHSDVEGRAKQMSEQWTAAWERRMQGRD